VAAAMTSGAPAEAVNTCRRVNPLKRTIPSILRSLFYGLRHSVVANAV
jgi:hypothetical protein